MLHLYLHTYGMLHHLPPFVVFANLFIKSITRTIEAKHLRLFNHTTYS